MVTRTLLATVCGLAICASVNAEDGWYHTYEEAQQIAERDNLPLLIHFHATYCGPCRQMDSQVFSQPEVKRQLRQGLVAVDIDVQQRQDLALKFGASSIPRDVVVYPGQAPQTLNSSFKPAHAYLDMLREVAARGAQYSRPKPVTVPETAIVRDTPQDVPQETVIGIEGFCPVRLMQDRQWIPGHKDMTEVYRGITYQFSSSEALAEFRADPRRYTPQNLGCDPVVLYSDQQAIMGRIQYGVFFDSQLFLFESDENRKAFKENPLRYGRIQSALKVGDLTSRSIN
ncbi:MAG: thioredoxin family protein [Planctomycetaceae bacterium]